jgi:hypothetical protein
MLEWESSHGNFNGGELYDPDSDASQGDRKVRALDTPRPPLLLGASATAFDTHSGEKERTLCRRVSCRPSHPSPQN